jgi:hypothetical protein
MWADWIVTEITFWRYERGPMHTIVNTIHSTMAIVFLYATIEEVGDLFIMEKGAIWTTDKLEVVVVRAGYTAGMYDERCNYPIVFEHGVTSR